MIYDAIVAGLGAMGSAAVYHLARRGAAVLGVDRFRPPHTLGSSHGRSRIIRQAYFEHPQYVPLVQRAYRCWSALETECGARLFVRTGGLMIGAPDSAVARGALRSAAEHGLPHELLSAAGLRARYPVFRPRDETVAVWEPDAGYLRPEACIAAHLSLATARGAVPGYDEPVLSWAHGAGGVTVTTTRASYRARRLVLAAGAWNASLAGDVALPLTVERQVQHWFVPAREPGRFDAARFPVFIWEHERGHTWYGIPSEDDGVKLALHHHGEISTPDAVRRTVAAHEAEPVRALIRELLPDADGPVRASVVCLYTNTPDDDFIIDSPPGIPELIIASPCSGHGFKFSSAIGETIAASILDGGSEFDLTPFRLSRFR
jgi:sarcosine oxidase